MPSIIISGMQCEHCRRTVEKAVAAVPGVLSVTVDLASGRAEWTESSPVDLQKIAEAVRTQGFEVK